MAKGREKFCDCLLEAFSVSEKLGSWGSGAVDAFFLFGLSL